MSDTEPSVIADEPWHYDTAVDIDQTLLQRLGNFPREPDMLIYSVRSAAAISMRAWLRIYHRLRIDGIDRLPPDGQSFVMIANHASHLDALCLLAALPLGRLHQAFPLAAQDYFFDNLRRSALSAVFINAVPFSRAHHVRQSLALCRRLLEKPGTVLILFPEGTRSATGELADFRPGVGALVAGTGVPVVPCGLQGTGAAWPKHCRIPRPRPLRLVIGSPRRFDGYDCHHQGPERIARELQESVKGLLCP
jgi:1-acyl-sn-glycerol-3-phosphate acyltransferase